MFVQDVKKSALEVQSFFFFFHLNYLLGSLPLPSPSPSSLLPGFIDERKRLGILTRGFGKNVCHLVIKYIHVCYPSFDPLLASDKGVFRGARPDLSWEIDIWVERGKMSVVVEKIYISKKQPELNELRQTVLLK